MPKNLREVAVKQKVHWMQFLGDPGSGKTVAACSYPGKIYVMVTDDRIRPVAMYYPEREDIEFDSFGPYDFDKFVMAIEKLKRGCIYKTVVVDLTSMAKMALSSQLEDRGKGKQILGIDLLGPEEISFETQAVLKILDNLRVVHRQGVNVIVTAHRLVYQEKNEVTGESIFVHSVVTAGRKLPALIKLYFDEVYYFFSEPSGVSGNRPKFKCRTVSSLDALCKTAYKNMAGEIDWTDQNFYEVWKKALVKAGYESDNQ